MSSAQVMEHAENLYRQGMISYPRTETNSFDKATDLKGLVEIHAGHPTWGQYARELVGGKFRPPRNGKSNDQSHPPIHPTKMETNFSKPQEKSLYELIVRHFLACCSEDAHGFETSVTIDIASEKFTTKGLMVVERNYLDIYPYEKWNSNTIPVFQEGEKFIPTQILFHESQTKPPNLLTEAELIDLMDKNGIIEYSLVQAGSSMFFEGHGPFKLLIGNSESVELFYNETKVDLASTTNVKTNVSCLVLPEGKCSEFTLSY